MYASWPQYSVQTQNNLLNVFLIAYLNLIIWAPYFHYVAPITVLGYSAFNTVIPTIGMFGMFFIMLFRFSKVELELSLLLFLYFIFFYFIQRYLGITSDNLLKYYVQNRFVFNIFLIIIVLNHLNLRPFYKGYLFSLLLSFLFANITSLLFMFGLPTFRIYKETTSIYELGRFGGIWGAPNGFAYLIALVCFAVVFLWRIPFILRLLLYFLSVGGWIMAGSRLCALFYILMFPFVFLDIKKVKGIVLKYLIILAIGDGVVLTLLYTTDLGNQLVNVGGAFMRFVENQTGEDVRFEKNSYFFGKLLEHPQNCLFGIAQSEQISNVVEFSDNGILLFMLNLGIPFFVVYGIILFRVIFRKVIFPNFKYLSFWVLLSIIIITFYVNNATIWDNYIFVSILILFLYTEYMKTDYRLIEQHNLN